MERDKFPELIPKHELLGMLSDTEDILSLLDVDPSGAEEYIEFITSVGAAPAYTANSLAVSEKLRKKYVQTLLIPVADSEKYTFTEQAMLRHLFGRTRKDTPKSIEQCIVTMQNFGEGSTFVAEECLSALCSGMDKFKNRVQRKTA